jgi:hypothetical protein
MGPLAGNKRETRRNSGLETVGIVIRPPSAYDFDAVRTGFATTVVAGIRCGECDGEWDDAFPPVGKKESVCPRCGALNRMFSEWMIV